MTQDGGELLNLARGRLSLADCAEMLEEHLQVELAECGCGIEARASCADELICKDKLYVTEDWLCRHRQRVSAKTA